MKSDKTNRQLKNAVQSSTDKIDKAKKERNTLLAQTVYLGTLGFLFIIPVVAGAYVGVWIDNKFTSFSFSWTISLILLGVFIGGMNVYLFIKEK